MLKQINVRLDKGLDELKHLKWIYSDITVKVPINRKTNKTLIIKDFPHRDIIGTMSHDVEYSAYREFMEFEPYEHFWSPPNLNRRARRLFSGITSSKAFGKEYRRLLRTKKIDDLPIGVYPIMLASDATMVASYGGAKAWPQYMWSGALPGSIRRKGGREASDTIAFFPSVSFEFRTRY